MQFSESDSGQDRSRIFSATSHSASGMEAIQGAHYWARVIRSFGDQVRLIVTQFVKPYVKGQKNDPGDAAAIAKL
jgi:transposase